MDPIKTESRLDADNKNRESTEGNQMKGKTESRGTYWKMNNSRNGN